MKAVVDGAVTYYAFDGLNVLADYDGDVSAQRTYLVLFLDDSLLPRTGGSDYHCALHALGTGFARTSGNRTAQAQAVVDWTGARSAAAREVEDQAGPRRKGRHAAVILCLTAEGELIVFR